MHLHESTLRAWLDQQLSVDEAAQTQAHLRACAQCQADLQELRARAVRVQAAFDQHAPRSTSPTPRAVSQAYQRFTQQYPLNSKRNERIPSMMKRKPIWAALAVFVALALVFSLTPASAWASNLLGLFRVQKVQVISFDPSAATQARSMMESNRDAVQQIFQKDLQVSELGDTVKVADAAEAADKAGFTPRLPTALSQPELVVRPGMHAELTLDQPKLQGLINEAGMDVKLPPEVNGKKVMINVSSAVVAASGCPANEMGLKEQAAAAAKAGSMDGQTVHEMAQASSDLGDCTLFVQTPSPTISAPDGLNVQQMGKAMFEFLGMAPAEAEQLSQRIDWTSTLILPIPQGGEIQYQDVQVDGVTGTLLQEPGPHVYSLVWVKDGMLYGLHGPGSLQDALSLVASLK